MASEHWRPQYFGGGPSASASEVYVDNFYAEEAQNDDAEDEILRLLLEAFPGISIESLAVAYARADRDPNLAAEFLAFEASKNWESASNGSNVAASEVSSDIMSRDFEALAHHKYACELFSQNNWEGSLGNSANYFVKEDFGKYNTFVETTMPRVVHLDDFQSENENPKRQSGHEEFAKPSSVLVHSDDFRTKDESHQMKHKHGEFSGAAVWRNSPGIDNRDIPPDSSLSLGGDEIRPDELTLSSSHSGDQTFRRPNYRSNKLSASAPSYEFLGVNNIPIAARMGVPAAEGDGNGKGIAATNSFSPQRFKPAPHPTSSYQKLSAVTGTVSSQMQRRVDTSCNGNRNGKEIELRKKKKKVGAGDYVQQLEPDDAANLVAAEEFLHSMLGGVFGIDVVRDVLGYYAGDTDKAVETLLHMGSTSSGFNYSLDTDKESEDSVEQATNALQYEGIDGERDEYRSEFTEKDLINQDLLMRLQGIFPKVELSFLNEVLQAADFSFEEAVDILKESGIVPVGQQVKLDPAEVLQALFRTEPEPQETRPSNAPVSTDSWSVVAAKVRVCRKPDSVVADTSKPSENGPWNEYTRHRSSANEHWDTMKKYMKEAAAAYSRGDRVVAGVLSEKGAKFKQLAQEASIRASQNIFNVKNKDIENNITIDLHSQHVTEALQLLKLHLRSLSQIPSVHTLTVITGQGSHSFGGRAKIKPALTKYLEKRHIPWIQQNAGCIFIKMADVRELEAANHKSGDSSSETEEFY